MTFSTVAERTGHNGSHVPGPRPSAVMAVYRRGVSQPARRAADNPGGRLPRGGFGSGRHGHRRRWQRRHCRRDRFAGQPARPAAAGARCLVRDGRRGSIGLVDRGARCAVRPDGHAVVLCGRHGLGDQPQCRHGGRGLRCAAGDVPGGHRLPGGGGAGCRPGRRWRADAGRAGGGLAPSALADTAPGAQTRLRLGGRQCARDGRRCRGGPRPHSPARTSGVVHPHRESGPPAPPGLPRSVWASGANRNDAQRVTRRFRFRGGKGHAAGSRRRTAGGCGVAVRRSRRGPGGPGPDGHHRGDAGRVGGGVPRWPRRVRCTSPARFRPVGSTNCAVRAWPAPSGWPTTRCAGN